MFFRPGKTACCERIGKFWARKKRQVMGGQFLGECTVRMCEKSIKIVSKSIKIVSKSYRNRIEIDQNRNKIDQNRIMCEESIKIDPERSNFTNWR